MEQALSIGDLLSMLRRRLPVLLSILVVGLVASAIFVLEQPPVYRTGATIVVESQTIPDELARSTVDLSAAARLQLIQQRLMARDNLIAMINKLGLYADAPAMKMATKVDLLRKATSFETLNETGAAPGAPAGANLFAFTISSELSDPQQVTAVVNELVDSAIASNLEVRANRSRDTLAYFQQEEQRVGAALADMEGQITDFKKANEGALPESLQSRRDALARNQSADLDIDHRILDLQTRQADLTAALAGERPLAGAAQDPLEAEQQSTELELAQKRTVLGPRHPEIRKLEDKLAALKSLTTPSARKGDASAGAAEARRAAIERQSAQLDDQIAQLRAQKQGLADERSRLEDSIRQTPEVEIGLNALTRRMQDLQTEYTDVARRRDNARTGEQLETSQQSERFQVLESALVPEDPVGPNRKKLMLMAGGATIALAFGVAFLLELLNPALRNSGQMQRQLDLRPVVSIPYVAVPGERWRRRGIWAGSLGLLCFGLWLAEPVIDRYVPLKPLESRLGALFGGEKPAEPPSS
ncbi:MAG: hypothetical protein U1E34_11730 [Amaricoccus sp.]